MKYLSILLLFLSACTSEAPPTTPPPGTSTKAATLMPSKEVYLSEINTLLRIPTNYQPISLKEYYQQLAPEAPEAAIQEAVEEADVIGMNRKIFVEEEQLDNAIWAFYGRFLPYMPINRETAPQAVALIKQQARQSGDLITFTEQKLGRTKRFTYIKLKGMESYETEEFYTTYYFISSAKRSFVIKVTNASEVDFQELINQIVFRDE